MRSPRANAAISLALSHLFDCAIHRSPRLTDDCLRQACVKPLPQEADAHVGPKIRGNRNGLSAAGLGLMPCPPPQIKRAVE